MLFVCVCRNPQMIANSTNLKITIDTVTHTLRILCGWLQLKTKSKPSYSVLLPPLFGDETVIKARTSSRSFFVCQQNRDKY